MRTDLFDLWADLSEIVAENSGAIVAERADDRNLGARVKGEHGRARRGCSGGPPQVVLEEHETLPRRVERKGEVRVARHSARRHVPVRLVVDRIEEAELEARDVQRGRVQIGMIEDCVICDQQCRARCPNKVKSVMRVDGLLN